MHKAGMFGLHYTYPKLAKGLKNMARLSAIASGNFNDQRRRYGSFILTIRNNTVVDINCNTEDYCTLCLGVGVSESGDECSCA
jgi:hypothetical protein